MRKQYDLVRFSLLVMFVLTAPLSQRVSAATNFEEQSVFAGQSPKELARQTANYLKDLNAAQSDHLDAVENDDESLRLDAADRIINAQVKLGAIVSLVADEPDAEWTLKRRVGVVTGSLLSAFSLVFLHEGLTSSLLESSAQGGLQALGGFAGITVGGFFAVSAAHHTFEKKTAWRMYVETYFTELENVLGSQNGWLRDTAQDIAIKTAALRDRINSSPAACSEITSTGAKK